MSRVARISRPEATFVTRPQPMRLPAQAARQLPDQSTTLRVESSSTDDSRLRDALPEMNNPPFFCFPSPDSHVANQGLAEMALMANQEPASRRSYCPLDRRAIACS